MLRIATDHCGIDARQTHLGGYINDLERVPKRFSLNEKNLDKIFLIILYIS